MAQDKKRSYVSQSDIPRHSLEEALRIPRTIFENYALDPTRPLDVAAALDLTPNSSRFRTLTGASIAYGMTEGGYNADAISVTDLGRRIVAPTEEGDDLLAKRIAILQPRVAKEFLSKYDSKPLPREEIAINVLHAMGVPKDSSPRVLQLILDNAKDVGVLRAIKGSSYVDLAGTQQESTPSTVAEDTSSVEKQGGLTPVDTAPEPFVQEPVEPSTKPATSLMRIGVTATSGVLQRNLQVDSYILKHRLGAGFSAEVWAADVVSTPSGVDITPGQEVAIKFYHAHAMQIPDQVIRIEREYRIAQRIRHRNLIRIYEFVLASSRPFHNFLVMDVAKGKPLKAIIPPTGLSVQKALQIGQQVLSALDQLHGEGALHRDIKPGNVSVDESPKGLTAVLLDLGIVSVMHEKSLTVGSRFLGSKHWAPYEQLVGEPLDERSDIYSVGALLYNMLTGDMPYSGKGTEAAIAVEMARKPLRLPDNISVQQELRDLINSSLSTDIKDRPESAKECIRIIEKSM